MLFKNTTFSLFFYKFSTHLPPFWTSCRDAGRYSAEVLQNFDVQWSSFNSVSVPCCMFILQMIKAVLTRIINSSSICPLFFPLKKMKLSIVFISLLHQHCKPGCWQPGQYWNITQASLLQLRLLISAIPLTGAMEKAWFRMPSFTSFL